MPSLSKIDKNTCNAVQRDMLLALEFVAQRYGVGVNAKGARFSTSRMTVTIEVNVLNEEGIPVAFPADSLRIGLPPGCYRRTFEHHGEEFEITGIKTQNRKYPVIVTRCSDSKTFKFPVNLIVECLEA